MTTFTSTARRIRITAVTDLKQLPRAESSMLDFWPIPDSRDVHERLCRVLAAHTETAIEDYDPRPGDEDPEMFDRLLRELRRGGCDLWAVSAGNGRRRTRFFVLPGPQPR